MKNSSTKENILGLLKDSSIPLSGEDISRTLSISRVAVWKHIQSLQQMGYLITADNHGYLIKEDSEFYSPLEFASDAGQLYFFTQINSTMDEARKKSMEEGPDRCMIIAGIQTDGTGRDGNKWISGEGGIYLSCLDKKKRTLNTAAYISLAGLCSLHLCLNNLYGIDTEIKWPDTLMLNKKKAAGVLTEYNAVGGVINWFSLGIGLNVNQKSLPGGAISISQILGKKINRKEILSCLEPLLYEKLDGLETEQGLQFLRDYFNKYSKWAGRNIRFTSLDGRKRQGRISGIDETGLLKIEEINGKPYLSRFDTIYDITPDAANFRGPSDPF